MISKDDIKDNFSRAYVKGTLFLLKGATFGLYRVFTYLLRYQNINLKDPNAILYAKMLSALDDNVTSDDYDEGFNFNNYTSPSDMGLKRFGNKISKENYMKATDLSDCKDIVNKKVVDKTTKKSKKAIEEVTMPNKKLDTAKKRVAARKKIAKKALKKTK